MRAAVLAALPPSEAPPERTGSLAGALARHGTALGQYEASVRPGGPGRGGVRSGRMMLERVPLAVAEAAAEALGFVLPPAGRALGALAEAARVPLIVGWDVRDGGPSACVKVYLNASDASESVRRALRERLGLPHAPVAWLDAPAVVGINALRGGPVERKLYAQHADTAALARTLGDAARALADTACGEGSAAGGIASWDLLGGGRAAAATVAPRAFFVALRAPDEAARVWRAVTELPGWDGVAVEAALPFVPGAARSVGVAVDGSVHWTVYYKPLDGDRPAWALEPAAVYRAGEVELGLFVEPSEQAARAFLRTARYALSVRERQGRPARAPLETLLRWAAARVREAEARGRLPTEALTHATPPAPWCSVPPRTR